MSSQASATTDAASVEPVPAAAAGKLHWAIAISLAGLVGWLGYRYPPMNWRIPDSMASVGALSPQSEQDALAAVVEENMWKNSLLKFGLAGLGLGITGIILNISHLGKRWQGTSATLLSGLAGGLAAAAVGLLVRRYFDQGQPIPFVDDKIRPLFCDSIVFAIVSALLLTPISVLLLTQPTKSEHHKAFSVPLAGILTGLLVPFSAAAVLAHDTNSGTYPPASPGLTELWFLLLTILTLILVVFMGSREPKSAAAAS